MEFLNIHGATMRGIAAEVTKDAEEILKVVSEAVFLFGFLAIFSKLFDERARAAGEPQAVLSTP